MILKYIIKYILYRDCEAYLKTMDFSGTKEELDAKVNEMKNNDCYFIEVMAA